MHEGKEGGYKILRIIAGLRGRLGVGVEAQRKEMGNCNKGTKERKGIISNTEHKSQSTAPPCPLQAQLTSLLL